MKYILYVLGVQKNLMDVGGLTNVGNVGVFTFQSYFIFKQDDDHHIILQGI